MMAAQVTAVLPRLVLERPGSSSTNSAATLDLSTLLSRLLGRQVVASLGLLVRVLSYTDSAAEVAGLGQSAVPREAARSAMNGIRNAYKSYLYE
jgi:hypothetical protein